jgi:hypothetical protein
LNAQRTVPNQKGRVIALFLYLFLLLLVSKYVLGAWLPPATGGKAVWFYTGLISLLLGNHLVTPYFSKPVDAISYSVAAIAAMYGAEELATWQPTEKFVFYGWVSYCAFVTLISFIAILTKNETSETSNKVSRTTYTLAGLFGNHRAIFGPTIVCAIYLFHRNSWNETFFISLTCLVTVLLRPDELLFSLVEQLKKIWRGSHNPKILGQVAALQTPNIFLLRQIEDSEIKLGTGLVLTAACRPPFPAIALDTVGRDDAYLLRAIETKAFSPAALAAVKHNYKGMQPNLASTLVLDTDTQNKLIDPILSQYAQNLIGIVSTDTSNERLFVEVITGHDLQQGLLIEVETQGKTVIYQLLDGLTKEEIVHHKNTYGYVRAEAKKIGAWCEKLQKFESTKWLPRLNEPTFTARKVYAEDNVTTVGHFPGGDYPINLKSIDDLVTHNTAILGILGVGKTMLAVELVERMANNQIKVVCLDLTDQYAHELADYYNAAAEQEKIAALNVIGAAGKTNCKQNVEEGGSCITFRAALKADLETFLNNKDEYVKIYNPAYFDVWKQDSKPFSGVASMASLTPCQITHIISEVALELMQNRGMSKKARLCLIYEEAHSLVPEWNSVVADGDKQATSGTARAILQGRKFGMGCMLITQRTANVTKTILNQCNTIFAMRTFDDTGRDFLANYIGGDYAKMLPALPERHAIFFGKASSCENPVLIRLNDRDAFRKIYREKFPPPVAAVQRPVAVKIIDDNLDGIPF